MDIGWKSGLGMLLLAYCFWQLMRLRERLDEQDARWRLVMQKLGMQSGAMLEPSAEVKALALDRSRYIDAIKLHRQQTGASLKEAKAVVDRLAQAPGAQH